MDILVNYVVGKRKERILRHYWDNILMVDQAGRYYGAPLKDYIRITQRVPNTLTIFNMVVDAVIRRWVMMFAKEEAGPEYFGWAVQ